MDNDKIEHINEIVKTDDNSDRHPFLDENGKFKKGVCPNPHGRPKGSMNCNIKIQIKQLKERIANHGFEEVDISVGNGAFERLSRVEAIMNVLFDEGINKHNIYAVKEYLDRTIGKPAQEIGLFNSDKLEEYEEKLKNFFNEDYVSATATSIEPAPDTSIEVST